MIGIRLPPLLLLCAAGGLLLSSGCTMPMSKLMRYGPPVPGPLSSGVSPLPDVLDDEWQEQNRTSATRAPTLPAAGATKTPASSPIVRTSFHEGTANAVLPPVAVVLNLDMVLKLTCERNPRILVARERVNESQAAFDAAVNSCVPQFLRKDTFKRPAAEAELWRRRAELRKTQNDQLQDAANTYFDWTAAQRAEAVGRDLEKYDEKLLDRAQRLVKSDVTTAQVLVEAIQTGLNNLRQSIAHARQQSEAAAAKLAYLTGGGDSPLVPALAFGPVDFVDANGPVAVLVQQARDNGPGVQELQGLAATIQQGIDDARCAQILCNRTGAALVCGRLRMAQSELQQAQLALVDLHGKLRAGVEEAVSAILSGRQQAMLATEAIKHAAETYRRTDERLQSESPEMAARNNTYNAVLTSIQQLSQSHTNYITSVNSYNKAEARLLLLIGTYNDCKAHGH